MSYTMDEHVNAILKAGDTISAMAVLTTLAGFMPPVAALFAMGWYAVQIYESKTVQAWIAKKKAARKRPIVSQEIEDAKR